VDQLSQLENEMFELDAQMAASRRLLEKRLKTKPRPRASSDHILRVFLANTMKAIHNTCFSALEETSPIVHVSKLRDIEESIDRVIDGLCASGLFYETDPEFEARDEQTRDHAARLSEFLSA
jgi:hypothetical protein